MAFVKDIAFFDWLIIAGYFIAYLAVGKWAAKQIKGSDDFLIAERSLGKLPAALSTAATDLGGAGLVGCAGLAYSIGIAGAWWDIAAAPAWIILGLFLVGRLRKMSVMTVPEILEKRYGLRTRLLTSILYIVGGTINITAQTTVAAIGITALTGIPQIYTVIIAMVMFVTVTTMGGLIAVVWTDVLQYFVLISGVLLVVPMAVFKIGGIGHVLASMPPAHLDIWSMGFMVPAAWVGMCFFSYGSNQQFLQRVFSSKDVSTARFAYIFTGVQYLFYGILVAFLGMTAYILVPGLPNGDTAFAEMVKLVLPTGLKGLVLAGLLAATMSNSDSILNSVTTVFSIDIYRRIVNPKADSLKTLKVARIATVVIALCSLAASYFMGRILSIIVLANLVYSAGVFFPLIVGLFNKRVNANGAFCAILCGGIMAVTSKFCLYKHVGGFPGALHPIFAGAAVSLIILFAISFMTKAPEEDKVSFIDGLKADASLIEKA